MNVATRINFQSHLHLRKGNLKLWPYNNWLYKEHVLWPQRSCEQLCYFCPKTSAVFMHISKQNEQLCQKGPGSNPSPGRLHVFKPGLFSYPEKVDYFLLILVKAALFHRCFCCICQKRTTRNLVRDINTQKVQSSTCKATSAIQRCYNHIFIYSNVFCKLHESMTRCSGLHRQPRTNIIWV